MEGAGGEVNPLTAVVDEAAIVPFWVPCVIHAGKTMCRPRPAGGDCILLIE